MNSDLIIFKPDSQINQHDFHSVQWMQNLLTDEEWDVSHGRYQTLENIKLFKNAQTLNLTQLKLRWTLNTEILQDISPIEFPYLKQLFLNGNNIMTIEPITQVNLPNLEVLNLKENFILTLGSLRKCKLPNLKQISLYKNKITDIGKVVELNNKKLQKIWYNGKLEEGNLIISITWLAKLESNSIKNFFVSHNKRVTQDEAMDKLSEKMNAKIKYEYSMQDDRHLNWL